MKKIFFATVLSFITLNSFASYTIWGRYTETDHSGGTTGFDCPASHTWCFRSNGSSTEPTPGDRIEVQTHSGIQTATLLSLSISVDSDGNECTVYQPLWD